MVVQWMCLHYADARIAAVGRMRGALSASRRCEPEGKSTMQHISKVDWKREFDVLFSSRNAQVATMVLKPGDCSDDSVCNEHPNSEQWVYIVSGTGSITTAKRGARNRTTKLKAGDIVLIEKAERHQIRNIGKRPLRTMNLYVPPAYDNDGEVISATK